MNQKETEINLDGPYLLEQLNCTVTYDDEQKTCQIRCPIRAVMLNPHGIVHGGMIHYLADSAMGFLNIRYKEGQYVTLEAKTSYLKAAESGSLLATARYVKDGRHVNFLECTIENDKGQTVSVSTATFYRLPASGK